jgi:hypothetical protein
VSAAHAHAHGATLRFDECFWCAEGQASTAVPLKSPERRLGNRSPEAQLGVAVRATFAERKQTPRARHVAADSASPFAAAAVGA